MARKPLNFFEEELERLQDYVKKSVKSTMDEKHVPADGKVYIGELRALNDKNFHVIVHDFLKENKKFDHSLKINSKLFPQKSRCAGYRAAGLFLLFALKAAFEVKELFSLLSKIYPILDNFYCKLGFFGPSRGLENPKLEFRNTK